MKTGKVAKAFGIDRKTVSNWTDMLQFEKFFTAEAKGLNRTQRDYLESDLLVINTIRAMRNENKDWHEIAAFLETGARERELPASAMLVETTAPIAQYGRMVELQTALEAAEEQIDMLQEEVEHMRKQLQERVDEVREQERQKASDREKQLLEQIIALNRQMAKLEVRMEMMHEDDSDDL